MARKVSSIAVITAKVMISVVLLVWVVSRINMVSVGAALSTLSLSVIVSSVTVFLVAHLINALKLSIFLQQISISVLIRQTFIALLYGTVLPGQLAGDAVKAYRIAGSTTNRAFVVAAVIVDKIVGLAALILLTIVGLWFERAAFPSQFMNIALALLFALFLLLYLPLVGRALPAWLQKSLGQVLMAWHSCAQNFWRVGCSLMCGLLFQTLSVFVLVLIGTAMGISLSLFAWCVVFGSVSLVLLLPVSVAGVGLREGALVTALAILQVPAASAVALSLTWLGLTLFGSLVGFIAELLPTSPHSED